MQTVRRAVYKIKNIIDTGIQLQHLTNLMIGREAPQLITLAIAVNLIVSLAAETTVDTHSQLVFFRELMIPGGIHVGFVVRHTVDSYLLHHVFLRVILVGFGIQIAITATSREMPTLIAHGEINAIGLGIFHILVLAHIRSTLL